MSLMAVPYTIISYDYVYYYYNNQFIHIKSGTEVPKPVQGASLTQYNYIYTDKITEQRNGYNYK